MNSIFEPKILYFVPSIEIPYYMIMLVYKYTQRRPTRLNSMGTHINTTSGRGRKKSTFIYIILGRGRKTVGASAPIRWAPFFMIIC